MGQYYLIVNLDKGEFLHPHKFGEGLKLMEFGNSQSGTLLGLAVLLASGNNRGGGDLRSDIDVIGSWAGDRVVVAGDYADAGEYLDDIDEAELQAFAEEHYREGYQDAENVNLYSWASHTFTDISDDVIQAIVDGEGERHPLAGIDMSEEGWRQKGTWD